MVPHIHTHTRTQRIKEIARRSKRRASENANGEKKKKVIIQYANTFYIFSVFAGSWKKIKLWVEGAVEKNRRVKRTQK